MYCVRETEIPVEQQPPQVVFVCDHAGLVINKLYLLLVSGKPDPASDECTLRLVPCE